MTVDEQLDKLGPEYRIEMEKDRQKYFLETMISVINLFKCSEPINKLAEVFPIVRFLEAMYDAGFYRGLMYGIESTQNMIIPDSDIPVKYSQEMSDEINKAIIERNLKLDND